MHYMICDMIFTITEVGFDCIITSRASSVLGYGGGYEQGYSAACCVRMGLTTGFPDSYASSLGKVSKGRVGVRSTCIRLKYNAGQHVAEVCDDKDQQRRRCYPQMAEP